MPSFDFMAPIVSPEKFHPYFYLLLTEDRYEAARNLIQKAIPKFIDVDGNYAEQFQTSGFNARLWELFLHILFEDENFKRNIADKIPDFCLEKGGQKIFVEATTVGPSDINFAQPPVSGSDIIDLAQDYMPIKYGSALLSKKRKNYSELPHVSGFPLVFAVHDYHQPANGKLLGSMSWSRAGLATYLYGIKENETIKIGSRGAYAEDGRAMITRIEKHTYNGKEIPSGFFLQPESQKVSAILFSNGATISTFNRMGKLAGLGSENYTIIPKGVRYGSNMRLEAFAENILSPTYSEKWSDTVVMYHNPFAEHPIDADLFPNFLHINFDYNENEYIFIPREGHIPSSQTMVLSQSITKDE